MSSPAEIVVVHVIAGAGMGANSSAESTTAKVSSFFIALSPFTMNGKLNWVVSKAGDSSLGADRLAEDWTIR
jgi:hypothetical protein